MESITSLMGLSANEIGNPHLTLTELTNFDKFVLNHFANHCNPQSQTNGLSEMSIWKKIWNRITIHYKVVEMAMSWKNLGIEECFGEEVLKIPNLDRQFECTGYGYLVVWNAQF